MILFRSSCAAHAASPADSALRVNVKSRVLGFRKQVAVAKRTYTPKPKTLTSLHPKTQNHQGCSETLGPQPPALSPKS